MYCRNCGSGLSDRVKFCTTCGAKVPEPDAPAYRPTTRADQIPSEYKPLSPWAYFGYSLLYSIPLIGLILMVVFALNNDNVNRRNHARSMFCGMILGLIFGAIVIGLAIYFGFDLPRGVESFI